MTKKNKEIIEAIDIQIKDEKAKLNEYEHKITDIRAGRSFASLKETNKSIEACEKEIRILSGRKEWIKAQSYLEKIGVKTDCFPDAIKITKMGVVKFWNKRYLQYRIDYWNPTGKNNIKKEDYISTQKGSLIYTTAGKILFNEDSVLVDKNSYPSSEKYSDDTFYGYDGPFNDGRIILDDDEDLIICMKGGGVLFDDNYHFKLKDGKYNFVHAFNSKDYKGLYYSKKFELLKTTDGTKLGEYHGRLYDITKGEFLTEFNFDSIRDSEAGQLPSFNCNGEETLRELMTKQNALLGHKEAYGTPGYHTHIYGLIDTKGNLAENLVYIVKESYYDRYFADEMGYPQIFSTPVSNDTFYDVINRTIREKIERTIEIRRTEKEAERERERLEYEQRKKKYETSKRLLLSNSIAFARDSQKSEDESNK